MKEIQTIIEDYRKGDLTQRLFMFLEFRELRDEFVRIDQSETTSAPCAASPRPAAAETSVFRRWIGWLRSPISGACCPGSGSQAR